MLEYLPDASADLITLINTFGAITGHQGTEHNQHLFMQHASRVLRPGGEIILTGDNMTDHVLSDIFGGRNDLHSQLVYGAIPGCQLRPTLPTQPVRIMAHKGFVFSPLLFENCFGASVPEKNDVIGDGFILVARKVIE